MEWQLPTVPDFNWASPTTITREQWVEADGGFWIYPPARTDREPVWISDAEARATILGGLSAIVNAIPWVGDVKGVIELFGGTDLITGEKLAWWERALGAAGFFTLDGSIGRLAESTAGMGPVAVDGVLTAMGKADEMLDYNAVAATQFGPLLEDASEQLRQGTNIEGLEWRQETTALLHVGMLEAGRLTEKLGQQHALSPEQAAQVQEILLKAFVRQAQADGLLPQRLQVVPSMAEGGDPGETIDVWDPMTGTAWDVPTTESPGGSTPAGRTMPGAGGTTVITQVVTVPRPSP